MTDTSNQGNPKENLFFPESIRQGEEDYLKTRGLNDASRNFMGVGLSGGGIRSATFCLGVFQELANRKQLRQIDYLSTVSGGGYFGGFFTRLLARVKNVKTAEEMLDPDVDIRTDSGQIQRWLRENGRYLAPEGSGSMLYNIAIFIRNWFSMLAVVLIFGLTIFLGFEALLFALHANGIGVSGQSGFHLAPGIPLIISSLLFIPLVALTAYYFPAAIAYWSFSSDSLFLVSWLRALPVAVLAAAVSTMLWIGLAHQALIPDLLFLSVFLFIVQWIATIVILAVVHWKKLDNGMGRNWLSLRAKEALVLFLGALALAVIHSVSLNLAQQGVIFVSWLGGLLTTSLVPFVLAASKLGQMIQSAPTGSRVPIPKRLLVGLMALLVLGGLASVAGALAHYIFNADGIAGLVTFGIGLAVCFLVRFQKNFVNRCGLLPLYTARLVRAYFGASNEKRYSGDAKAQSLTHMHPGDDLKWQEFCGMFDTKPVPMGSFKAPIHIVNVTINETVSGRSQVQQQDRKGLGLAVSPFSYSAGAHNHYRLSGKKSFPTSLGYNVFADDTTPEALSLGQWVGVSGAAFNTGLGYRTSLGISLLTGIFNIRLGYWWDSGQKPVPGKQSWYRILAKWLFPVQVHLFDEWTARFKGTVEPRWHLSDGGHFENLAGYELIRRKVPIIVIVDAEADSDYNFQGLANLIRKARLDFGAEIEFFDRKTLHDAFNFQDCCPIGTLEDLRRGRWSNSSNPNQCCLEEEDQKGVSRAHAALARVSYQSGHDESMLLYIKPTLTGREPTDVVEYHRNHPSFPHETTADQFFDEMQWESYRKLGKWSMEQVLDALATSQSAPAPAFWEKLLATVRSQA